MEITHTNSTSERMYFSWPGAYEKSPIPILPLWENRHLPKLQSKVSKSGRWNVWSYATPEIDFKINVYGGGAIVPELSFSLTFEEKTGGRWTGGGAWGPEHIQAAHFSREDREMLLMVQKWHLWDFSRGATHYHANAEYWLKECWHAGTAEKRAQARKNFISHINLGVVEQDQEWAWIQTMTEENDPDYINWGGNLDIAWKLALFLDERHEAVMTLMHSEVDQFIQYVSKGAEKLSDYLVQRPLVLSQEYVTGKINEAIVKRGGAGGFTFEGYFGE